MREFFISSHHKISAIFFPLAVVVAEGVNRRDGRVPGKLRKQSLVAFWAVCCSKGEELKLVTQGDKARHRGRILGHRIGGWTDAHISFAGVHPRHGCVHGGRVARQVRPRTI